nr:MAG TPA: hypothetical protein [Caudoviricetes sp.]
MFHVTATFTFHNLKPPIFSSHVLLDSLVHLMVYNFIRQVHKNQLERFGNYVNTMSRM